jgi:hypothetical protein
MKPIKAPMKSIAIVLLISLTLLACKTNYTQAEDFSKSLNPNSNSKQKTDISKTKIKNTEIDNTEISSKEKKSSAQIFPTTITVDFYSKGSGINRTAFSKVEEMLKKPIHGVTCEFEKKLKKYGREGERKYFLLFSDQKCLLSVKEQLELKLNNQENVRILMQ